MRAFRAGSTEPCHDGLERAAFRAINEGRSKLAYQMEILAAPRQILTGTRETFQAAEFRQRGQQAQLDLVFVSNGFVTGLVDKLKPSEPAASPQSNSLQRTWSVGSV